jgi:hypothetical protein
VNVLDENIVESQRQLLRSWRIRVRQIGHDLGQSGMGDEEIIPLLRRTGGVTFFTRDLGFFDAKNRSRAYSIVCLAVGQNEVGAFVRRVLRHPELDTKAKRMGKIIRVADAGIRVWRIGAQREDRLSWPAKLTRSGRAGSSPRRPRSG